MSDIANLATNSLGTSLTLPVTGSGTYYTRVRAANGVGLSIPSNEVKAVVGGTLSRPSPPVDLKATVTGSTILLTWEPPASGDSISNFVLKAGSSSGLSNLASFTVGDSTNYRMIAPAGTYFVRVRAVNPAGVGPPSSDVVVRVVHTAPCSGPPRLFSNTMRFEQGGTSISLSAAAETETNSFILEMGSASGRADLGTYEKPARGGNAFGLMLYGLAMARPGLYFNRVRAKNACGVSEPSNEVVFAIQ